MTTSELFRTGMAAAIAAASAAPSVAVEIPRADLDDAGHAMVQQQSLGGGGGSGGADDTAYEATLRDWIGPVEDWVQDFRAVAPGADSDSSGIHLDPDTGDVVVFRFDDVFWLYWSSVDYSADEDVTDVAYDVDCFGPGFGWVEAARALHVAPGDAGGWPVGSDPALASPPLITFRFRKEYEREGTTAVPQGPRLARVRTVIRETTPDGGEIARRSGWRVLELADFS